MALTTIKPFESAKERVEYLLQKMGFVEYFRHSKTYNGAVWYKHKDSSFLSTLLTLQLCDMCVIIEKGDKKLYHNKHPQNNISLDIEIADILTKNR